MLVARLKWRDRALEPVEDSRPKFQPIQVCAQPLESFDQISHNRIGCLFRHSCFTRADIFQCPCFGVKELGAVWFPHRSLRG